MLTITLPGAKSHRELFSHMTDRFFNLQILLVHVNWNSSSGPLPHCNLEFLLFPFYSFLLAPIPYCPDKKLIARQFYSIPTKLKIFKLVKRVLGITPVCPRIPW